MCHGKPEVAELTISDKTYTRAKQTQFTLDFTKGEKIYIKVEPDAVAYSGELRFTNANEDVIDDVIDSIKMRVNGEIYPLSDVEPSLHEESHRSYKVFIPFEKFTKYEENFTVEPYVDGPTYPLILKPDYKEIMVSKAEPEVTNHVHFKVVQGMFVEGKTIPPVSDAIVTVQRDNQLSLKDRVPTTLKTDSEGRFKHGPVEIDTYSVTIEKNDFDFTRVSQDSFDFTSSRQARLEVKIKDSRGTPLGQVLVTLSSGADIQSGTTDENGVLYFHKVVPKKQDLTVFKKEFDFGKGHIEVEIGQSEHVVKEITGQRISFSAYGTLRNLSGQAISEGIVVARHEDSVE